MSEEAIAVLVFMVADVNNAARLYSELVNYTGCRSHIRDEHHAGPGVRFYVSTCGLTSYEDVCHFLTAAFGEIPRWILQWNLKKD